MSRGDTNGPIPVDLTLLGGIARPLLAYKRCRELEGIAWTLAPALAGRSFLWSKVSAGPFPRELQTALERVGAETLLARTPARARDLASRFDFSAAAINCGDAIDTAEFRQLLDELGSMPVLLYGTAPPSYVSGRAPFLATSKPTRPEAIVKAVAGLLSS